MQSISSRVHSRFGKNRLSIFWRLARSGRFIFHRRRDGVGRLRALSVRFHCFVPPRWCECGACGRCIGGVISGERARRGLSRLTLTSSKCWRPLRWASNRGKESQWQFLAGASAEPATDTVPVFMQEIINYWSEPLKSSFSDGIQGSGKLVTCGAVSAFCAVPVRGAKLVLGSINRSYKRSFQDSSNPSDFNLPPLPIIDQCKPVVSVQGQMIWFHPAVMSHGKRLCISNQSG